MQVIRNISLKNRLSAAEPARSKLSLAPAPEQRLLNRELSLIEFFRQVLDEARDERNPLLERLRFLTIFSSIVDEFFMVRVSVAMLTTRRRASLSIESTNCTGRSLKPKFLSLRALSRS